MKLYVRYRHGDPTKTKWVLARAGAGFGVDDQPHSLTHAKEQIAILQSGQPFLDHDLEIRLVVPSFQIPGCEVVFEQHQGALNQASADLDAKTQQLVKALAKLAEAEKAVAAAQAETETVKRKLLEAGDRYSELQRKLIEATSPAPAVELPVDQDGYFVETDAAATEAAMEVMDVDDDDDFGGVEPLTDVRQGDGAPKKKATKKKAKKS